MGAESHGNCPDEETQTRAGNLHKSHHPIEGNAENRAETWRIRTLASYYKKCHTGVYKVQGIRVFSLGVVPLMKGEVPFAYFKIKGNRKARS